MLTIEQAFQLAYGREISARELDGLSRAGVTPANDGLDLLRSIVASFDRQFYPTPLMVRFGPNQLTTVDLGTFKLVLDTDDVSVSRPIMALKDYEHHLRVFAESVLRPGMTVVDIGANVGFYTMLFASIVGETGKVFAFEPNSENNRLILLSQDVNNFPQVRLFPFALTEKAGAAFFTPALGSNGTLLPETTETLADPNCIVVPCQRLDAVVTEQIDFIKIDIEGAEYRALSGAIELIRRWRPIVTTEFSLEMLPRVSGIGGADFLRWMTGFGYRPHLLNRDGLSRPEIDDIDGFISSWGDPGRIEDLAFLPNETFAREYSNVEVSAFSESGAPALGRIGVTSIGSDFGVESVGAVNNMNRQSTVVATVLAARDAAMAERDLARSEVYALRRSTSWRLTAPLRALGAAIFARR